LASLFVGHAAQKSKLHNLQNDEGCNHMAETDTETEISKYVMWRPSHISDPNKNNEFVNES
jgi:hypothetical protein